MNIFNIFFIITLVVWVVMFVMWVISIVKKKIYDMNKYCLGMMISALFLNIFTLLNKL